MEPAPRGSLELSVLEPPYPRARCAKGVASLGRLYPRGGPVIGARVVLEPGGFSGTTDGDGKLRLSDMPGGTYTVKVSAPSHAPAPGRTVEISSGVTTRSVVRLTPCVSGGKDRLRVGFGASISLGAVNNCGATWDGITYSWSLVEGPDIRASVKSWTGKSLTFTTAPIQKVRKLPDEARVLSFSPDEAGQYVFRVMGRRKDGKVSGAHVMVTSTDVTGGISSVSPGNLYYFVGKKKGPWKWKITTWPSGWIRTLEGANTRTPSVLPLPSGPMATQQNIVIEDENSEISFKLVVGYWNQINRDCGRYDCHPPLQKSWEKTRHATTWQKLLDGELKSARAEPAESCATCHSLGHDPAVDNWGYDDVARLEKVTFPLVARKGNYRKLPASVKEVSNVYCLACHGPARVDPPVAEQPGRFGVGICARCHDRKPEQDLVSQWRQSKMSRTVTGDVNGAEAKKQCSHCHTAQGFYYKNFALGRPPNSKVAIIACCENLEPITCQTCHSPMYANNKAQVFRHGDVTTDSGLELTGVGSGALCSTCHNTEHDITSAATLTDRLAPHSPQADLSYGRAGYSLPAPGQPALSGVACSRTAGEGCVTCHMDSGPPAGQPGHRTVGLHTFRMTSSGGLPNLRPCQACHGAAMQSFDPTARGDHDGDGSVEGVRAEVDGLMALLKKRLAAAMAARAYRGCDAGKSAGRWVKAGYRRKVVVTDELGFDLGDCDRNGVVERTEVAFTFPLSDVLLHKAAYNYLLVSRDGSRGLHNLPYTIKLLQRTVHAVAGGKNLPAWELHRD